MNEILFRLPLTHNIHRATIQTRLHDRQNLNRQPIPQSRAHAIDRRTHDNRCLYSLSETRLYDLDICCALCIYL